MGPEKHSDSSKTKFNQAIDQLHPRKRGELRDDLRRLEVSSTLTHNNDFWARQRVDGLVIFNDVRRLLRLDPSLAKQIRAELWMIMCLFGLFTIYLLVTKNPPSPSLITTVGVGAAGLAVLTTRLFKAWWFAKPGVTILFTLISGIVILVEIIAAFFSPAISLILLKLATALVFSACMVLTFHLSVAICKLWKHNLSQ